MRIARLGLTGLLALVLLPSTSHATPVVVESVNGSAAPFLSAAWGVSEVGWLYTPATTYDLTSVTTKFGSSDSRTITLEIYTELPSGGGTLLRSAGFTPVGNVFAGPTFAPLTFVAGEDYFIGFRNVVGLLVNVTIDSGATNLGPLYFGQSDSGSYADIETGTHTSQPILQFLADDALSSTAVPEPASLALLCTGLGALAVCARRRARRR